MVHASLFPVVHYWAHFQGLEAHVSLTGVVFLGIFIGLLAGFFGIGGQLLMTPLLNIFFNIPYNVVVGTEICQMLGSSSMNVMKFKMAHNVDYKLAVLLFIGAAAGVEGGAKLLEVLKMAKQITFMGRPLDVMFLVFGVFYGGLLLWIGATIYRESKMAYSKGGAVSMAAVQMDMTARLQTICLRPMISLPFSGIENISLWIVLGVGFSVGLLVGFFGVGGSFIGLPALVYVLGCPMGVAIATDLFESLLVMGYGTYSHSLKGNIDLALAVVLLLCTTLGTQLSLPLTRRYSGRRARQGFAFAAYLVVLLLIMKFGNLIGVIGAPRF
jgi:uncharacterized membrane protein YfcA